MIRIATLHLAACAAAAAGAPVPQQCGAQVVDPVDCSAGDSSLTQDLCVARGCCWHPSVESPEATQQPEGCITGKISTPKQGVVGGNVWSIRVPFPDGKIDDGDPVAAEIMGYIHNGHSGGPGPCCGNKFSLSTANITERGFDLVVTRVPPLSTKPGWGQELIIGWKAGTSSCKFPSPSPSPGPPPPPSPKSQCFYPKPGSAVEVVHMINSNHFDAGYADWTSKVLNEYFHKYFPQAALVGAELKHKTGMPLRWMTFAYIVSLFLDCPANYGVLACPTAAEKKIFVNAVKEGHIVFPAFPTNAELALADPSMLSFGVQLSKDVAASLGMPTPGVVSTRDVPGMPRSSIPVLKKAGVNALSEGMNGRMVAVNAPPVFSWKDPVSGESMLTMWHFGGYGSIGDVDWLIRIPGSTHALAYCWRGDNAGPPGSAAEVQKNIASVRAHPIMAAYPKAQVITSTLENVSTHWIADGAMQPGGLPEVTKELSDTWIWGAGSDPVKVAQMRAMHRLRNECEAAGQCKPKLGADPAYYNFSRQLQKNLEHTWGISIFHYGKLQNSNWTNQEFHADLAANNTSLEYFVQSWIEQRNYGIHYPLAALQQVQHPLAAQIEAEFARMEPVLPEHAALKPVPAAGLGQVMQLGGWCEVQLDTKTGALVHLSKHGAGSTGSSLASPSSPLFLIRYQTLIESDFQAWQKEYILPGKGGETEFGKPSGFMTGPNGQPITKYLAPPTLRGAWTDQAAATLLIALDFAPKLHTDFGAPASAWLELNFSTPGSVGARLTLQNKTATRLPEAAWVTFQPVGSGVSASHWEMDKLGEPVSPLEVADGASKGLHAVLTGVNFTTAAETVLFESLDAAVVRWDKPAPFPTPLHTQPDLSFGASFLLFDNIWNTNYPDWLPFNGKLDLLYRFGIHW